MAERRMFAKTIIDSDAFLEMPISSRLLYYDLAMRADDDGFNNAPLKVMRTVGATTDDLNILISRKFIIPFDSGVVVIKHWRIHNYIRRDTYNETPYKELKAQLEYDENKAYRKIADSEIPAIDVSSTTRGRPVDDPSTQVRLGKDSIGKDRLEIGEDRGGEESPDDERPVVQSTYAPYEQIKNLYNEICKSLSKCTAMSEARKKCIKARLSSGYTMEHFKQLFEKAEASSFMKGANSRNWRATFDWLIKDSNMAKVLDGNYDDHVEIPAPAKSGYQQPQQQASRTFRDILREAEEKQ